MKSPLLAAALLGACGFALAKLPPLDDAAKAKAAETAAKAAWQGKVDNWQLCKSQDRVAAHYRGKSAAAKPAGKDAKAAASAPAAMPTAAASAPAGTPVAAAPPAPCADPGPFAYTPPDQKPLEAAGAHSPTATAASPPSGKQTSAAIAPASAKK